MSLTISLSPAQVEERLGSLGIRCAFSTQEKAEFATTPVVNRSERIFAFPTPRESASLSLSNIKSCVGSDPRHQPSVFEHPWYEKEDFFQSVCAPGWHLLAMDVIQGSTLQPVDYLRSSGIQGLVLPQAVEVVLMLFLHYVGSREQLLLKKHSWCRDTASMDRHVTVGAFGRNGVFLSGHPANFVSQGLGICAKVVGDGGVRL
jgi:hypothetical protein